MNATQDRIAVTGTPTRRNHFQRCKFCDEQVNLDAEGTQYRDGTAAHETCDDGDQFTRANETDFLD